MVHGEVARLRQPHPLYHALGADAAARKAAYSELFRYELDPGVVDAIRQATNGNYALGDSRHAEQIAAALGRRVAPGKPGRPPKAPAPASGSLFE